jgi:hypothetical protein
MYNHTKLSGRADDYIYKEILKKDMRKFIYITFCVVSIVSNFCFGQQPEDYLDPKKLLKRKSVSSGNTYIDTRFEASQIYMVWVNPDKSEDYKNYNSPLKVVSENNSLLFVCTPAPSINKESKGVFKLYIDNNLVSGSKSLGTTQIYETRFDKKIDLIEGTHGYKVSLTYKGKEYFSPEIFIEYKKREINLYVYSFGVNHSDLKYTQNDANEFSNIFYSIREGIYKDKIIAPFTKAEETTGNAMQGFFEELAAEKKINKNDVLIIFISSHGNNYEGEYSISGSDFTNRRVTSTSLQFKSKFMRYLDSLTCKKIIFLDACKSGNGALLASRGNNQSIKDVIENTPPGTYLFASSSDSEPSWESNKFNNGVFTEALIEGLQGKKADTRTLAKVLFQKDGKEQIRIDSKPGADGEIWLSELKEYLELRVPELAKEIEKIQNPTIKKFDNAADFPIYFYEKK